MVSKSMLMLQQWMLIPPADPRCKSIVEHKRVSKPYSSCVLTINHKGKHKCYICEEDKILQYLWPNHKTLAEAVQQRLSGELTSEELREAEILYAAK